MGFNAGVTKAVGNTPSHTEWNNYYGAAGSMEYLKGQADLIDACSQSANLAGGTRALGTVYQNTGGKVRFVTVTCEGTDGASPAVSAYVELSDDTPDVLVAKADADDSSNSDFATVTFVVPPNAYYTVSSVASLALTYWFEWDWC